MNLTSFLNAVRRIGGPLITQAPEVLELVNAARQTLSVRDQAQAEALLKAIQIDNDEGFARLDAKLAEAEGKG